MPRFKKLTIDALYSVNKANAPIKSKSAQRQDREPHAAEKIKNGRYNKQNTDDYNLKPA